MVRATPLSRRRSLLRDGALVPVPLGPADLMRTPLLSRRAKWRLLAEAFVPAVDGRDESVASFIARRMGPEVVSGLVGPFLTGVYAGDDAMEQPMSMRASIVDLLRL
jgi:oxygen-dependent protoporphyrinogen oxidase